jgi:hypothetical protein
MALSSVRSAPERAASQPRPSVALDLLLGCATPRRRAVGRPGRALEPSGRMAQAAGVGSYGEAVKFLVRTALVPDYQRTRRAHRAGIS